MQEEINAADAVARAVDRITYRGRFAEFELSNGIVIEIKPVPPLLIQAIVKEFVPPEPPVVFIEEKDREEQNPNDPTYLKAVEELQIAQAMAVSDLMLGVGTKVKHVPDGYYPPEDDGWIEQVQFAAKLANKELDIDTEDKTKRYIFWLRFYAFETSMDAVIANAMGNQLTGIREGEVDEVVDSFRNISERRTHPESTASSGSENGNTNNRATRRRRS